MNTISLIRVLSLGLVLSLTSGAIASHHASHPPATPAPPAGFVALFNGKDFKGWKQMGGKAKYTVENGEVVGTTVAATPNSFMTTKKLYSDFILELDFKVHPKMNSGVQIRSHAYKKDTVVKVKSTDGKTKEKTMPAGRVHGYQVEIDPDMERARLWTGGIYDEGRRGWLNDLSENEAARKAFKPNEWNHFRIQCVGDSIKTWLNGVPAADLKDGMTPKGFIALQVHGIGNSKEKLGHQVRWRNIYLKDLSQ